EIRFEGFLLSPTHVACLARLANGRARLLTMYMHGRWVVPEFSGYGRALDSLFEAMESTRAKMHRRTVARVKRLERPVSTRFPLDFHIVEIRAGSSRPEGVRTTVHVDVGVEEWNTIRFRWGST